MKRTSFTATTEELKEIDDLKAKHGFATRAEFLRIAALRFGSNSVEEDAVRQLTQAVYWLHKIQNAQSKDLHLLKTCDVALMMKQLSSALATINRVG